MRFDTSNFRQDAKMYSAIGTDLAGADELVQNGMVGKIGERIVDNIYEFLPLEANDKEVFYMATPEVDEDETKIANNTLYSFALKIGQVGDVIQGIKHDKFAIADNGIGGLPVGGAVKGQYVYAKVGERKLQYSVALPTVDVIQIAVIEDVVPATQGLYIRQGTSGSPALSQIQMQYNLIRCRVIA